MRSKTNALGVKNISLLIIISFLVISCTTENNSIPENKIETKSNNNFVKQNSLDESKQSISEAEKEIKLNNDTVQDKKENLNNNSKSEAEKTIENSDEKETVNNPS
jgi:hypothetical protein